jgi:folate-binding protein YgfZ
MPQDNTGFFERKDRGLIVVSGTDRASYLQGLLTNDVAALKRGDGCYAAYLTAQGRMITDLMVYELGDVMLLALERDVKDTVLARLDQVVFSEDVQLGDVTESFGSVVVIGPGADRVAGAVVPEVGNVRTSFGGEAAIVLRNRDYGVLAHEMLVGRRRVDDLKTALQEAGAPEIDEKTAEAIRIEHGVPKFHRDMDEETIPLEAGIEESAISFSKGCYVGQEVIIRVLHRGHGRVARRLVGLTLEGGVAAAGAGIQAEGREVGRVTSAIHSGALGKDIALGYVQRDFVEPGTRVTAGGIPAVVTKLPFRAA